MGNVISWIFKTNHRNAIEQMRSEINHLHANHVLVQSEWNKKFDSLTQRNVGLVDRQKTLEDDNRKLQNAVDSSNERWNEKYDQLMGKYLELLARHSTLEAENRQADSVNNGWKQKHELLIEKHLKMMSLNEEGNKKYDQLMNNYLDLREENTKLKSAIESVDAGWKHKYCQLLERHNKQFDDDLMVRHLDLQESIRSSNAGSEELSDRVSNEGGVQIERFFGRSIDENTKREHQDDGKV